MIKKLKQTVDTYYGRPTLYAQRKHYTALQDLADVYLRAGLCVEALETYTEAAECCVRLYHDYGSLIGEASPAVRERLSNIQRDLMRGLHHIRYNQVDLLINLKRDPAEIIQTWVASIQAYRYGMSAELQAQDSNTNRVLYQELVGLEYYLRSLGRTEDALRYCQQAADLYRTANQEDDLSFRTWFL